MATLVTYQWKRNGVPVPGAHSRRYEATEADSGAYVSCYVTKKNANTSTSKEFGYQYPSLDILVYTPPVLVAELGGGHVKDGDRISLEGNGEFIGIQKSTVLMWYINNIFLLANYAEVGLRIKLADGMEVGDKITCKVKVTNKWGSIEVPAEGFYTIMP